MSGRSSISNAVRLQPIDIVCACVPSNAYIEKMRGFTRHRRCASISATRHRHPRLVRLALTCEPSLDLSVRGNGKWLRLQYQSNARSTNVIYSTRRTTTSLYGSKRFKLLATVVVATRRCLPDATTYKVPVHLKRRAPVTIPVSLRSTLSASNRVLHSNSYLCSDPDLTRPG